MILYIPFFYSKEVIPGKRKKRLGIRDSPFPFPCTMQHQIRYPPRVPYEHEEKDLQIHANPDSS